MNDQDLERLRAACRDLWEQTRQWGDNGFPGEIRTINLRRFVCQATPRLLVKNPSLVPRGVRFHLQWDEQEEETWFVELDACFVPEGSPYQRGERPALAETMDQRPYGGVQVVVPHDIPWQEGLIGWKPLTLETVTKTLLKFYADLLQWGCTHENCNKIFRYKQRVVSQVMENK